MSSHTSAGCIDATAGKDGTPLRLGGCGSAASQRWTFTGGTIRSVGLCMDLAGANTANGTTIQVARCNGGWAQQFTLNAAHDLVNPTADKCVTVQSGLLVIQPCNGTDPQKWSKG
ncbi:RICIN domain-containing protein [Pseudonocardia xinjiangensis]|uniref:RICIN domain-containing protein n=1 Tax=Pseudonocardia xinjiangensis TaxID=75289 RepID=A0ABX1RNE6_9PSEU|nr:RICIN domain-containing protein [Pseudonocardia xinjiangensis]